MHSNEPTNINSRQQRKLAYRARNRLLSIHRDAHNLKQRVFDAILESEDLDHVIKSQQFRTFPWLANKNCGSWYLPADELTTSTEVYFKSSDGHITSEYALSLKRLNLPLIELLHSHDSCFLVDSSIRKLLPDSFSRTIPVWCCVMNRIVQKYRGELGNNCGVVVDEEEWDVSLYTPSSIVSPQEHSEILNLIDSRVDLLYTSKAIVNPAWLVQKLTKPLRPIWITEGNVQRYTISPTTTTDNDKYFTIICCNPSYYSEGSSSTNHIHWVNHSIDSDQSTVTGYYYTPGSADDDSEWGRGLTPELFWAHYKQIIAPNLSDDGTDEVIDIIVRQDRHNHLSHGRNNSSSLKFTDKIGEINLWIGSFEAGKPPDCWESFDAVLNVTENEYPEIEESIKMQQKRYERECFYLQLPVSQGKRDRNEFERKWMSLGLVFIIHHLQQKRRVLVYSTRGRDRAVAVVLALVVLVCHPVYPLRLKDEFNHFNIADMTKYLDGADNQLYIHSGLCHVLATTLLKDGGRDIFLEWMHQQTSSVSHKPFADKQSVRIVLQLLTQYRETAEPTRSTAQKLNRFFMSSPLYRQNNKIT